MKTIILIAIALLYWQCGYSYEVCEVKRINNLSKVEATKWGGGLDVKDSCLRVLVPEHLKVEQKCIHQVVQAYGFDDGQHVKRITIFPEVVDKNGVGVYGVMLRTESTGANGCALYDGEQMLLPAVPEIWYSAYSEGVPEKIHEARLKVVEVFLKKYPNFTKKQKQDIIRVFSNGTFLRAPQPRYF